MIAPPPDWAIVGGGILGMTLALRLAEAGRRVVLVEAADRLGGLAAPWSLGDVVWDRHYHVIAPGDERLLALLGELGLGSAIAWRTTRTGLWDGARLHSLSNLAEFLRLPTISPVGKLRLAATLLHATHLADAGRLAETPIEDWLLRWSGREVTAAIWAPLLRAKLGDDWREAAAVFIAASMRRLYRARRRGSKQESFGHVQGGYARILAAFAARLAARGVEVRTGCRVTRIRAAAGGHRLALADGDGLSAPCVAVTVPAPLVADLLPDLGAAERAGYAAIRYQGIVCASLLLDRPLAGFYVTNLADATLPFTGVIEMSALVDPAAFGGRHLVYLPRYLPGLARLYPDFRPDQVLAFRLSRVRHVFALPRPGQARRLPAIATALPGLAVVNAGHIVDGTLNVDETLGLAARALGQIADWPAAAA